jgi:hypothetical protein
MAKYNQNELRQWPCGSTGYKIANANNSFEFTGNLENKIMPIPRQRIIQNHIIATYARIPHAIHCARNVTNRTTAPANNSSLRSIK